MATKRKTTRRKSTTTRAAPAARAMFRVSVGRFDEEPRSVTVGNGETVSQMLSKAGITLSTGERVKRDTDAQEVDMNSAVEEGVEYFITSSYKSGN